MSISGRPSVFVPQGPRIPGDIQQSNAEFTKDVKMYRNLTVGMPYDVNTHPYTDTLYVNGNIVATGSVTPGGGSYANFYALMPGDNSATVAIGANVQFPRVSVNVGGGITVASSSQFTIANAGNYEVLFQVSTNEAGQLAVALNGTFVPSTVAGRATGTNQIVGMCIIPITAGQVLSIQNAASASALTITPTAGGTNPVSANLVIRQV